MTSKKAQGGRASSLPYLIGANRLLTGLKSVRRVQYTAVGDHTTLMARGETEIELKSNGKCAIRTVTKWPQTAEIKLNAEKTQLISLGQNRIKELEINGEVY